MPLLYDDLQFTLPTGGWIYANASAQAGAPPPLFWLFCFYLVRRPPTWHAMQACTVVSCPLCQGLFEVTEEHTRPPLSPDCGSDEEAAAAKAVEDGVSSALHRPPHLAIGTSLIRCCCSPHSQTPPPSGRRGHESGVASRSCRTNSRNTSTGAFLRTSSMEMSLGIFGRCLSSLFCLY